MEPNGQTPDGAGESGERKEKPLFSSVISLNQPMPAEQAAQILADYHNVSQEVVLR